MGLKDFFGKKTTVVNLESDYQQRQASLNEKMAEHEYKQAIEKVTYLRDNCHKMTPAQLKVANAELASLVVSAEHHYQIAGYENIDRMQANIDRQIADVERRVAELGG
jgi:ABC-type phosphate transport system auxiliary subunit